MNREPEDGGTAEELARGALSALAAAPADPAFRATLRREFVTGEFAPRTARVASVPARVALPGSRVRRAVWYAVPAALAATLIAVSLLNRAPALTVSSASGEGVAVIGGIPVPMNHVDELERMVRPGVRIRIPDGTALEVEAKGVLAIQVTPGTDVVLPRAPGRWFGRVTHAEVTTGELRITTGNRFHGARLAIETPEARVEVRGTTLAVICEPQGTCVCVFEGAVRVGEKDGPMTDVTEGNRRYVFHDGRAPESAQIREGEVTGLGDFRKRELDSMK
jgi:hypothetical protein